MTEAAKKQKGHFRKHWGFYSLLVIAIGVSSFLWASKAIALKNQAKEFNTEKKALINEASLKFEKDTKNHLEAMMKTFVWAVRGELTRDNEEQIIQYFAQLVKSENIQEIDLTDNKGNVFISTNKKNEGQKLSQTYSKSVLNAEEVTVIEVDNKYIVAAPVMSIDSRLGSLVLVCNKKDYNLEGQLSLTEK